MQDYFNTRRSIRRYSDRPVDRHELVEMLREASHAPTTGNMQLYSVVVTDSAEGRQALSPAHFNQPAVTGCQVVLTFCADFNRFVKWCEVSGAVPGYDNFQSWMTSVLDTVIFAQQFVTIAEMRGMGTCYMGTTTYNAPMIGGALGLPERVVPVVTVTLGWPEGESEVSDRLEPSAFVHYDCYHNPSPEEVRAMYVEKEAREDSRRFVAENNKQSLAQVFTDVRYTRQANEAFSKVYFDYIREQGFSIP